MRMVKSWISMFAMLLPLAASSDVGGTVSRGGWTWVSGHSGGRVEVVYGMKGVSDSSNVPGRRQGAVGWADKNGNLWLFGGYGEASPGPNGLLNDLWKFDGTNWTWVSGGNTVNQGGVYGKKSIADASNVPGGRTHAVGWIDSNNNLWLFGGEGYASGPQTGTLNDLWKFDGKNWTWVSGSNTVHASSVYGIKGVSAPGNVPGARSGAVSWIDSHNNLWLFGGSSPDPSSMEDNLEVSGDLWKFDGTNWTWVSGSRTVRSEGVYGTKGKAASSNVPGGRRYAVGWIDSKDNLWLFGGHGKASPTHLGNLNDLWKFDGTNWTWMSGSFEDAAAVYGTKGIATSINVPGGRHGAVGWVDGNNNLWLFGGYGGNSMSQEGEGRLNDLWKFDGSRWTWVSGSNTVGAGAVYGTKGVFASSNVPGARKDAVGWVDRTGNFWLFGGDGHITPSSSWIRNDLWRYRP